MTIKTVDLSKSQITKNSDENNTTPTTVVHDNLFEAKPLANVSAIRFSSLFDVCTDAHTKNVKRILSKVKSAKINIARFFTPATRVSETVARSGPSAIPIAEHRTQKSSTIFIVGDEPIVNEATACESILCPSSEAIAFPIDYGEDVADERIKESISIILSPVGASSMSPTLQHFAKPKDSLPSTFFLDGLYTIEEEDGSIEVAVEVDNTMQKERPTFDSYISLPKSDSWDTVYSADVHSDYTAGSVSSESETSPINTSLATSIDVDDNRQLSPLVLRGLRKVPSYEDLRIIAIRGSPCADIPSELSNCLSSDGAVPDIDSALPSRSIKCDVLSGMRSSNWTNEQGMVEQETSQTLLRHAKDMGYTTTKRNPQNHIHILCSTGFTEDSSSVCTSLCCQITASAFPAAVTSRFAVRQANAKFKDE